jgi:hypothetical protein
MYKKIIFVMPPEDWFYGIDYNASNEMINELKKNNKNKVYIFNDINIFLKKKISTKDTLKLIYIYFFFKIKKIDFVIALNASYTLFCNLIYKNKIINFFADILNIKCILRWDHINQQIPNVVERIYEKAQFSQEDDYRDFFFKYVNRKNFVHFTWQKKPFITSKDLIYDFFEKNNVKLDQLSFSFFFNKEKFNGQHNNKIILSGYFDEKRFEKKKLIVDENLFKNKENFYKKKYHNMMLEYSDYLIYQKKKLILNSYGFYGITTKNKFKAVYPSIFFKNISKYFIIINPHNPANLTMTFKLYIIFLHGGFCLSEFTNDIPRKLYEFRNYIFYKNQKDLDKKISFLKKNENFYIFLKNKIYRIALEAINENRFKFKNLFLNNFN